VVVVVVVDAGGMDVITRGRYSPASEAL